MYKYYENQSVLPTFANLKDKHELADYAEARARFFTDKLYLPPFLFRDADVVEIGPDTGENALAFARWGAKLTLVEPNNKAWPKIETYFDDFDLRPHLQGLVESDVQNFSRDAECDIIVAEGFIYTVQPTAQWLDTFNRLLKTDGLFIISFYERLGGFVELALKAIHAQYQAMTDTASGDAVKTLFQTKWDSIPHTRTIDSWVMDVFDNPFVRLKYFLGAGELYREAWKHGFSLFSSWPKYRAPLEFEWHKNILTTEERWKRDEDHLLRSSLSFLTGRKMYLVSPDRERIETVHRLLQSLVENMDALIDSPNGKALMQGLENMKELSAFISNEEVLLDDPSDRENAVQFVSSLRTIFEMIEAGDAGGLVQFANNDPSFINGWGLPYHCTVFRKMPLA